MLSQVVCPLWQKQKAKGPQDQLVRWRSQATRSKCYSISGWPLQTKVRSSGRKEGQQKNASLVVADWVSSRPVVVTYSVYQLFNGHGPP